jgi:hypothetical protein
MTDRMSKYHLQDLISRIGEALDLNNELKGKMLTTCFAFCGVMNVISSAI